MIPKHTFDLIEAIKATGKKISKDDAGLIATCSIFAKQNRRITDKQSKWLQNIYANVTGGGQYEERQRL